MKNIKMICVVFVSLAFSGVASAGFLDSLNQAAKNEPAVAEPAKMESAVEAVKTEPSAEAVKTDSAIEAVKTEPAAETAQAGLIDTLMKQLGVTSDQAQGGSGALFDVAKNNLSESDFSQVSEAVPGMDGMLAAAPKSGSDSATGNLLSGLAAASGNSTLTDATSLINTFQQLGLSEGMVGKFTPVIIDYVKQNGSEHLANILQAALTGS
jgi:hypothetical protein